MVLGIRCSNSEYYYVVLRGNKASPIIDGHDLVRYPDGFKKPASLKWMVEEIKDRVQEHQIQKVVMKGPEGMAVRTSGLLERVEYEASVYIACAEKGIKAVFKKVKSTIAKDLGLKGKAKYLKSLDTSCMKGFDTLPEKGQEAALAAWSELD